MILEKGGTRFHRVDDGRGRQLLTPGGEPDWTRGIRGGRPGGQGVSFPAKGMLWWVMLVG